MRSKPVPVQFTCENCGYDTPWMDAGLYRYEHRNQCPSCLCSKHVLFGSPAHRPCDGLMRPRRMLVSGWHPLIIQECDGCGFRWVSYDEDWWAALGPGRQTALINTAWAETERQNSQPVIMYSPRTEYQTYPPPMPEDQLAARRRCERRP